MKDIDLDLNKVTEVFYDAVKKWHLENFNELFLVLHPDGHIGVVTEDCSGDALEKEFLLTDLVKKIVGSEGIDYVQELEQTFEECLKLLQEFIPRSRR